MKIELGFSFFLAIFAALLGLFMPQQVEGKECYRLGIGKTFDVRSTCPTDTEIALLVCSDGVCDTHFTHARVAFTVEPADAMIEVAPQGWMYEPTTQSWETTSSYHNPELGQYVYYVGDARGRDVTSGDGETPAAIAAFISSDQPVTVTVVDIPEAGIWDGYLNWDHWIVRSLEITTADDVPGACTATSCAVYPNQWACEMWAGEWLGDNSECPVAVEYELPADAIETPYTSEVKANTRRTPATRD